MLVSGSTLERFLAYYNVKDWDSMRSNSAYGGLAFAGALTLIACVGAFDGDDNRSAGPRRLLPRPWAAPIARTPRGLLDFRGLQWQRSPWLLCAALANLLPWLIWAPQRNAFARCPGAGAWYQLLPGPLGFFATFAGSTQAYTTFWATQLEGRLAPGTPRPARAFAAAVQFLGIVCAFAQSLAFTIPWCLLEGHAAAAETATLYSLLIAAMLEWRERTRFGSACLPPAAAAAAAAAVLGGGGRGSTAHGVCGVLAALLLNNYLAFRVARRRRFRGAEYAVHVLALTFIAWMGSQYMINWCINKSLPLQPCEAAADGMPDRSPSTRHAYWPMLSPFSRS